MPFRQDTMIFIINLIHRYRQIKCRSLETLSFARDNHVSVEIIINVFFCCFVLGFTSRSTTIQSFWDDFLGLTSTTGMKCLAQKLNTAPQVRIVIANL